MKKRQPMPFEAFLNDVRFDENDYIKTFNNSFRNLKDFEEDVCKDVYEDLFTYQSEIKEENEKEVDLCFEFLEC
jgi:hypothetical protein